MEEISKAGKVILIIDDTEETRELMKFTLESEGYKIEETSNAAKALARLKEGFSPDLIILDFVMPNMDGLSFLKELEKNTQINKIPVLLSSAKPRAREFFELRGAKNIAGFLNKPFSTGHLKNEVKRILG